MSLGETRPFSSLASLFWRSASAAAAFRASFACSCARFSSRALISSAGETNFTRALPSVWHNPDIVARYQNPLVGEKRTFLVVQRHT